MDGIYNECASLVSHTKARAHTETEQRCRHRNDRIDEQKEIPNAMRKSDPNDESYNINTQNRTINFTPRTNYTVINEHRNRIKNHNPHCRRCDSEEITVECNFSTVSTFKEKLLPKDAVLLFAEDAIPNVTLM